MEETGKTVGFKVGDEVGVGDSDRLGLGDIEGLMVDLSNGLFVDMGNTFVFLTWGLKTKKEEIIKASISKNKIFDFIIYCSRIDLSMASWEEKRNLKSAITLIVLSVFIIAFLFFIGIPLVGKFASFLGDIRGSGNSINKTDMTPPAPPRFNNLIDNTNQKNFNLSGNAEANGIVKLTINGKEMENITDKNGGFSFNTELNEGENKYEAYAVDQAGNVGQKTKEYTINFDNKPPVLTIEKPSDNSNLFGSIQRQVTINGKTETNSEVFINDRFVSVDNEGNYQYSTILSEGENKFTIKSTDKAGNTSEKQLTLNFTP